ncbi:MAG: hypothetical protein H7Y31_11920 [Chitinophagaceae bacterium]|nr:hypothetical protein [Chitinophagaceae bacterium]
MKKIALIIFATFYLHALYSQVTVAPEVAAELKKDQRFKTYALKMTRFLDSLKASARDSASIQKIQSEYKKLARLLFYLEGHQGANGEIVNVNEKTQQAMAELMQSPMMQTESPHLGSWSLVGPQFVTDSYGNRGIGRVDRMAFHPTDASTFYAGTPAGGLWKTANNAISWFSVNNYIPSLGISGIVVSHAAPSTLYVLTGDGDSNIGLYGFVEGLDYIRPSIGVLKSTDDGESWTRTALDIPGFYVGYKLIQSPSDANVLIAATSKGLYRTANGGSSWNMVSADSSRFYDVEWKPGSSATVYACTNNDFYMSVSAGQTFAQLNNRIPESITDADRLALAVTPNNPNIIYLLAGSGGARLRLFRSTDAGGNFFLRSDRNISGGTVKYMMNVAASPLNFNHVAVGNLNVSFSEDGGTTFLRSSQNGDDGAARYVHADIHELAHNPLNGMLYIGSDGGVFNTDDNGVAIFQKLLGMSATQFYHFSVADDDEDAIVGGAQDNGVMFKDGTTTFFKNYKAGDGFDIAMPHDEGSFVVASINTETYFFHRSFPSEYWFLGQQTGVWYKPVTTSWFDSTKYAGGSQVMRWKAFGPNVPVATSAANGRWALTNSPSNGNRLYAAGGPEWNDDGSESLKTLSRSDDNASTWTTIHGNPGFPDSIGKITSIAVHPTNSNRVYVTFGGYQAGVKVYYSANAGVSWTNLSAGLPNLPVNVVVVNDIGDVYIGNDIGVFFRTETGTWMPFFNGLPKVPVTDLQIRNSILFASTFGRGMWSTTVRGNCPPSVNLTGDLTGRIVYEATTITATSRLINGAGTEIYFKAANQTTLNPGFIANASTGIEFRAWIAACGTGGLPLSADLMDKAVNSAMQMDSTHFVFDLPFPAMVIIGTLDEEGNVREQLSRPVRMLAGKQRLPLPLIEKDTRIVMFVDGEVFGIVDMPFVRKSDEVRK